MSLFRAMAITVSSAGLPSDGRCANHASSCRLSGTRRTELQIPENPLAARNNPQGTWSRFRRNPAVMRNYKLAPTTIFLCVAWRSSVRRVSPTHSLSTSIRPPAFAFRKRSEESKNSLLRCCADNCINKLLEILSVNAEERFHFVGAVTRFAKSIRPILRLRLICRSASLEIAKGVRFFQRRSREPILGQRLLAVLRQSKCASDAPHRPPRISCTLQFPCNPAAAAQGQHPAAGCG